MIPKFKDLFISYGRRESLGFVGRLHQQLKLAGYEVWFDKVNIPDGDDYQQRINHGIESAHNFVYVMAPRCLTSPYCLIELEYARWLGKRVIPLNQMVIFATDSKTLSDGDKQVLQDFYALYNLPDPNIQTTQDVLNRSHAVVGKTDWLDAKEKLTDKDCETLLAWAQQYENHWAKHDQPAYLETFDFPIFGESIDTLDSVVERLTAVIERQTNYVYQQTEILTKALYWQQNNKTTPNLLVGEERLNAENWLLHKFSADEQSPCTPSALVCEFICESRKQADNRLTDIFIGADLQDQAIRDVVIQSLSGYVKTCWIADRDIPSGTRYEYAIEQGIEGADNFLWFLSPTAVKSKDCQRELTHALNYHKRIIPLLVAPTAELPAAVQNLQCVDFTKDPADYDHQINELLKILAHEQDYYQQHKMLLVRSRKWAESQRQSTLLLRGHKLELAKTWLRLNAQRQSHSPLPLHQEFITASDTAVHQWGTELFISYSRKDNDFVHQLTAQLQAAGKTIWFDQETQQSNINAVVDFEQETFKGIDEADNFIFIASPPSVASPYCQHEVNHAAAQGKRIIMLWYRPVESATIPAALQMVQRLDFSDPTKFETAWLELVRTLERDQAYVHRHTEILAQAQYWQQHQQATQHLLVGQERTAAQDWLLTEFLPPARPPCQPTPLMCKFIGEARKNAENLTTDIFICYEDQDKTIRDTVVKSLSRYAKTCWTHDHDIQKGESYDRAIERGIEGADNLLFFISPTSVASDYCQRELAHALRYHKRIIPLLIIPTPISERPDLLRSLQYIDFTNNTCQADYDSHLNEILHILKQDQDYYKQHKVLLVRALKWQAEHQQSSFLLRGYNLDNAKIWLRLSNQRQQHQPLELHRQLIEASEAAKGQLGTEVFISYSRKDSDFARHLNTCLQEAGKTTWFDQESISSGVDFEKEILKGIESADNFVFVISPNAVASEYCEREVNYAAEQSKRFISVLHRKTEPKTMPTVLQKINWIDFQHEAFDQSFAELVQAIELDREHTHQHTMLQQRANDWAENNNSPDFLLNQTACQKAEAWREVAVAEQKKPVPSELQIRFIQTSREAIRKANQRRNILFSLVGFLAIVAVIFAGVAFIKMKEVEQAKAKAEKQAQIALIEKLGAQSIVATESPSASNGSYEHAALLAVQAFKAQDTGTTRSNLLRVLQAQAHKKVFLYGHSDAVMSIALSPDGHTLASGSLDQTVRLWDVATQQPRGEPLTGHSAAVLSIAFSADGHTLASGSEDNTVRLWDVATRQPLGEPLTGHTDWVRSVAFSADGHTLASGSRDQTVRLWDMATQQPLGEPLTGHSAAVLSIAFSADGHTLASGSRDKTVRLWDVATHQLLGEPTGHSAPVWSVAFSADGHTLASGSEDQTVRLWDVVTRQPLGEPFTGHSDRVWSVAFSADGHTLASGSMDKTIRLWDVATHRSLSEPFTGHSDWVTSVVFSTDGHMLASGSYDKTVRWWDVATHQPLGEPFSGDSDRVWSVAFSADGHTLASGSEDNTVRLWDLATRQPIGKPLTGHSDDVNSVAFSADGHTLASGSSDKTVRLWDVATRQPLGEPLTGHSDSVTSVAFSADGHTLASGSVDKTVRLWDVVTRQPLGEPITDHSAPVTSVAFSADGHTLASGSVDKTVRLWDVATRQPLGEPLTGHTDWVLSVAFSADGHTLASGSEDNTVRLWDVATQQPLGEPFTGHSDSVTSVAFSADGHTLASGSVDKTVRLWDVATRQPLGEPFTGHTNWVTSVVFSADGHTLASGSRDQTVRWWNINPNAWIKQLCAIANRNLSHKEWQEYLGDRPHEKTCPELPTDTLGAIELVNQGQKLAKQGKIKEAISQFKQAQEWDANIVAFDPEAKAKTMYAIEQGEKLAKEGQIDKALAQFQSALRLDSNLNFDPETKAKKIYAQKLVEQGEGLAREGKIDKALAQFQATPVLDSSWKISAESWNTLCRNGSSYGHANKVMNACEKAVELAPQNGWIRDSRALARALTGDIQGAIEDFQFAIENYGSEKFKKERQAWVVALQSGENPFTKEVLEGLR